MNSFETRWGGWLSTILRGMGFLLILIFSIVMAYVCAELGGRQIRTAITNISTSSNLFISGTMLSGFFLALVAVMFVVAVVLVLVERVLPWARRRYAFHTTYRPYNARRFFVLPPDVAAEYASQPKPTKEQLDSMMNDPNSFHRPS